MKFPSVAIIRSDLHDKHSSSWGKVWIDYCQENKLDYSLVDWRSLNAFKELAKYDIVLWHFSHYSRGEMLFARSLLYALKSAGCRIFPDFGDYNHFDDKVAQAFLLESLGIKTPKNYLLLSMQAVEEWIEEIGDFPIVGKLRSGSGANNVKLIKNHKELRSFAKKMFGLGFKPQPNLRFKIKSNLLSSKSLRSILDRLKRLNEFSSVSRLARDLDRERGYVYLQEFIPSVDHDLKVVVVDDRLSFVARSVRVNDFRASGSGNLFYDRDLMTPHVIDFAFSTCDALNSECSGLDILIDPKSNEPLVLEVSYGFSNSAQLNLGGFFDRQHFFHDEPMDPPYVLIDRIVGEFLEQ